MLDPDNEQSNDLLPKAKILPILTNELPRQVVMGFQAQVGPKLEQRCGRTSWPEDLRILFGRPMPAERLDVLQK